MKILFQSAVASPAFFLPPFLFNINPFRLELTLVGFIEFGIA